ncbi:surfactin synthase thioesterase subunit [Haloactinospora alba]|uniref:Surfactin synthase thioesterase subunit n=1 Tax=Haloactinospora alba TaxID=405555 RepID=A0A543N990_9ACTN|nr:alpha/beta fold hydrolase [Haloactinospora alba]TQN28377.1 surfactin synthase thioesterase subunit [Haloactinospora alba]
MTAPRHPASPRAGEPWFDHRLRFPAARYSLYCFPFAGGSASYYADWAGAIADSTELVPIQLPGRGTRMAEPPVTDLAAVADAIAARIAAERTVPLLFGHSMGAIIAFETARRLESMRRPAAYLVVSGRPAPSNARPRTPVSALAREELVRVLRAYGSAAEEVLEHEELLDLLLPMIRADFAMIERYRYQPGPPLSCPIQAWCGDRDPEVAPEAMQGWEEETAERFDLFVRSGGHFFLTQHHAEVLRRLRLGVADWENGAADAPC